MKTPDQLARQMLAPDAMLGIRLRACCSPPLVEDLTLAVSLLLHEVVEETRGEIESVRSAFAAQLECLQNTVDKLKESGVSSCEPVIRPRDLVGDPQ
jgi:hypothetical protein